MATIENFILKFKVEGQQGIKQVSGSIKDLKGDLENMAQVGGPLANTLNGIIGRLGPLGLGAAAAGGAFVALGLHAVNLADALDDLSGATGISASEILSLKKSIIEAGGGADDYQQMLSKLRQATEEAAGGNDKFVEAFKNLGVYVLDANGKMRPTSDILQNLLEKFQKGEISGKAYAAAVDVLGKDINKMDITKLKAVNDPFQDEQIKQLAKYRTAIDNISNNISTGLLKVFGELAIKMEEAAKKADEISKKFKIREGVKEIFPQDQPKTGGLFSFRPSLQPNPPKPGPTGSASTSTTTTPNAGSFGGISDAKIKAAEDAKLRIILSGIEAERLQRQSLFDEIANIEINKKYEIEKITKEINAKKDLGAKLRAQEIAAKTLEIEQKAVNDIAKIREQSAKTLNEQLINIERDLADKTAQLAESRLTGPEKERLRIVREIGLERQKAIEAAAKASVGNAQGEDSMEVFLKQKEAIDKLFKAREENALADLEYQNSFAGGWNTAFTAYIQSATNAAQQAQSIFNAMTNGMNSAIDNFVETGKFSFSDFASSVIKDILKIQLKAAAANLFATGANFLGFTIPGKATGGPVGAGQPYVIGEQGPELFIPSSAGTIVPNNKLGMGGGAVNNTYVTNNISAVDAKSVAQLFAENRQVLFGNVEQARKELPLMRMR